MKSYKALRLAEWRRLLAGHKAIYSPVAPVRKSKDLCVPTGSRKLQPTRKHEARSAHPNLELVEAGTRQVSQSAKNEIAQAQRNGLLDVEPLEDMPGIRALS
jgi:hypothetical protein